MRCENFLEIDGHIYPDQTDVLLNFYNRNFGQYLKNRNFTVYLRASPDVTSVRRASRGREEEMGCVSLGKVEKISELHVRTTQNIWTPAWF